MQVASEDTVLAAAREYAGVLRQNQAAVYQALGPHIRCQHLSMFWLSACVHAKDDGLSALLGPFNKQLKTLLMMRHADSEYANRGRVAGGHPGSAHFLDP